MATTPHAWLAWLDIYCLKNIDQSHKKLGLFSHIIGFTYALGILLNAQYILHDGSLLFVGGEGLVPGRLRVLLHKSALPD